MSRVRVLPYRQGSRSAKALADALGGKVLKLIDSKFRQRDGDLVINWGSVRGTTLDVLNKPELIKRVSNKKIFFADNEGEDWLPPFWMNKEDIPDDAYPVVARTILAGHSGVGIVICNSKDDLVDAPLYVKYIKKREEYRIHVGRRGSDYQVICVQRKARANSAANVNWQVRNHANGFVFIRHGFDPKPDAIDVAVRAIQGSGLDFGAVDVVWNEYQQKAYALEVNTAPGLEGQTITDYANFFQNSS